jgi:diguanylate cyclase (GGDEF)-like protein
MRLFSAKKSIRKRLLAVLIVCITVALGCTIAAQIIVYNLATQSAGNIQHRSKVLGESRNLRTNLHSANEILTSHLLRPNPHILSQWQGKMNEIFIRIEALNSSVWVRQNKLGVIIKGLEGKLREYDQEVLKLINVRLRAEKQHPALFYARETMLPLNRVFLTASTLALEELAEEADMPASMAIHENIKATRYLWAQVISSFRMHIINRLGSFDEESLRVQEKDIETQIGQLHEDLQNLKTLAQKTESSIQVEDSLEQMITAAQQWRNDFKLVKGIHAGQNWRMDVVIIDETIRPIDQKIQAYLEELESSISDSDAAAVAMLANMAGDIVFALWSLMIAAAIISILGFIYLNRSVLQPIMILTRAIKSEAMDGQREALPDIDTEETQNLIEAFSIMRKQVHTRQTALEHQALHDALTGLPNRNLLYDRIQQTINKLHREKGSMALMMMDLDRFKDINDTLGHQVGDRILEQVSLRLVNTLRDSDTVARLGGDEFAVALPLQEKGYAEQVAKKILTSLEKPFHIDGYQLFIGASIGMALYPEHGDHVETLLRHADIAMYVSKRNNTGYKIYDAEQDKDNIGRLALSNDLRHALNAEELMVYYQPKLDLKTGLPYGVEALVRWNHAERGFIPPDQIIYIAEHTGLIKQLTYWVLKEAISQCSHWNRQGKQLSVSVNLSTRNLQDPGLFEVVEANLTTYDCDPALLILEVTESAMMMEPEHASQLLNRMDAMGVCISIDDFGTGFSSLAYLKQLPVDELKIDKSFVMNINNNENDAVIVRSTIDLAKNLGLKVVAEGVENADTWDILAILGCDFAQGFYMSKPLPPDQLDKWLQEYHLENRSIVEV